jgi:hypothetical protein
MSTGDDIKAASEAGRELVKQAPYLVCLLIIVGGFLVFMERRESREIDANRSADQIAQLRIDVCHDVQERSIRVMDEFNVVVRQQDDSFDNMMEAFREMEVTMHKLLRELERRIPSTPNE